jgi:hypothetical protein|eukprot:COSAG01_NODE_692_length_14213_cov_3.971518_7_plen_109_part_00
MGVYLYMTNRHILVWDDCTSSANRLQQRPIMGLFELQRFEVVHQRVDDMLMFPVPLMALKGYSLSVSNTSLSCLRARIALFIVPGFSVVCTLGNSAGCDGISCDCACG